MFIYQQRRDRHVSSSHKMVQYRTKFPTVHIDPPIAASSVSSSASTKLLTPPPVDKAAWCKDKDLESSDHANRFARREGETVKKVAAEDGCRRGCIVDTSQLQSATTHALQLSMRCEASKDTTKSVLVAIRGIVLLSVCGLLERFFRHFINPITSDEQAIRNMPFLHHPDGTPALETRIMSKPIPDNSTKLLASVESFFFKLIFQIPESQ
jgi:hypothetical protein